LALYAALGAGVLALLGGAFWFLRKRRAQQGAAAGSEESADVEAEVSDDLAQLEDLAAFAGGDEDEDAGAAPADAESSSDPIGEADMYMAYGRFQQAADILYAALQREPDRDDIRMKLAEVYAEMGDEAGAREQATALQATRNAGIRQQADALLARLGGGGAAAAAATAAAGSAEEQMPSLDDLAMEFSGGGDEPAQAAAGEEFTFDTDATEESLDFSLDDIDMGEAPAPASAAPVAAKASSLGELSLDDAGLGEFTLDEEPVAAAVEEELTLEDAGLEDFTLEDQPAETQEATAEFSLEDEFALEDAGGAAALELPDVEAPTAVQPRLDQTAVRPAMAPAADLEADLADLEADLSTEGAAEGGDDFDFLADSDENATKLDLARAYIDMGDADGARDILNEVVADGNASQKSDAQKLLSQLG
jgi:pilus assembly protein FimV